VSRHFGEILPCAKPGESGRNFAKVSPRLNYNDLYELDTGLTFSKYLSGGGDVFWTLIGDAVVVAFLAAQPQRLARAARVSTSARSGRWEGAGWVLWWRDIVNTFGDAILQVALFLAVCVIFIV